MIKIKNKKKCCGCGGCETICPKQCIELDQDENGFYYPKINIDLCVECGACDNVCPIINQTNKKSSLKQMYACSSYDSDSKKHSSSGGVFYLLADYVLSNNGAVFGVKMAGDYRKSVFTCVKSKDSLSPLLGSKYVQAHPEQIYKCVKNELKVGNPVLFSGTPCHVAALTNFLPRRYDNLYLIDISCHGVPSEKAWNSYIDCREKKMGAKVISACFRSKETGWNNFSLSTDFINGEHHSEVFTKDSYGKAFTERLLFRPSCESCRFKGLDRWSDITLADFWGIDEVTDQFGDDKGTSLVIIHTSKGEELLEHIRGYMKILPVSEEQGTRRNPYIYRSVVPHSNKKKFFRQIESYDFDEIVSEYATKEFVLKDFIFNLKRYIKRKIKNL